MYDDTYNAVAFRLDNGPWAFFRFKKSVVGYRDSMHFFHDTFFSRPYVELNVVNRGLMIDGELEVAPMVNRVYRRVSSLRGVLYDPTLVFVGDFEDGLEVQQVITMLDNEYWSGRRMRGRTVTEDLVRIRIRRTEVCLGF